MTCKWQGAEATSVNAHVSYAGRSNHPYAPHLFVGMCGCGFNTAPELSGADAWRALDVHRAYRKPRAQRG